MLKLEINDVFRNETDHDELLLPHLLTIAERNEIVCAIRSDSQR